ncbi:hypothetical protein L228DRAFT_236626 [Xylona heveae TC161]|uniref:Uncharacterized protein n=1 Tax=Xylona heveae (strain CBS 132557 / TC161) TaxID=1328760 RepID=A0A165IY83_XYLHT|nr:hypothetical protein L228DRAFT_236626 [Xylona heveae TC161]KZF25540.1 hypothetical protein L228DRAFT_236626 [Xylona heveae TC161]
MAPIIYQRRVEDSDESMGSGRSDSSGYSNSTAPTQYSTRPSFKRCSTAGARLEVGDERDPICENDSSYRSSVETYASTIPSTEDLSDDYPKYDLPESRNDMFPSDAIPSIPPEFAELFPSTRRLLIRHDDATVDGNMNLRVDTEVRTRRGEKRDVILFHLRMQDLKERKFSFRRYCRESGREICHSSRTYQKAAAERRPGLQRSLSQMVASLRAKPEAKAMSAAGLKRSDSGYASVFSEADGLESRPKSAARRGSSSGPQPTKTIKLECSNYAQVDLKRRGAKASKRYDFEYWGTDYSWKREARKHGDLIEVSYHLVNSLKGNILAHIVPEPLSPLQVREEEARGGWIPPCSMWISDDQICEGSPDVADMIVATGLIALVDDNIKRRFHQKRAMHLVLPVPMKTPLKMNMAYVDPKRLIDDVFNRSNFSTNKSSRRSPPCRSQSAGNP